MQKTLVLFYMLLSICPLLGFAQPQQGVPLISNYSASDYGAHVQNWMTTRDSRGIMFFANTDGILMYDASEWRLLPVKDEKSVLAVKAHGNRIYSGGANEFGFLEQSGDGTYVYTSLMPYLPENKQNFVLVTDIHVHEDRIVFLADNQVMQYTGDTVLTTRAPGRLDFGIKADGRYFAHDTAAGLLELIGEQFVQHLHSGVTAGKTMDFAIPRRKTHIAFSLNGMLYRLNIEKQDAKPQPMNNPAAAFLKRNKGVAATSLQADSIYAAGTVLNGIIIFNENGDILRHISSKRGMQQGVVNDLFKDDQGNLWLSMSNGISRIRLNHSVTHWNASHGLDGYVADIQRYKDFLFLATENGFAVKEGGKIKHLGSNYMTTWDLFLTQLPESSESMLLGAADGGLFQIEPGYAQMVWKGNDLLQLYQPPSQPRILYAGISSGLLVFRHDEGKWRMHGKIQGLQASVRSIREGPQGDVWLGTFRSGVYRLKPGSSVTEPEHIYHYTTENGLPSTKNVMVYTHGNRVLFATENGLYIFRNGGFAPDTLLNGTSPPFSNGVFKLASGSNGWLWFSPLNTFSGKPGYAIPNEKQNRFKEIENLHQIPVMHVLAIYPEEGGVSWIGGTEGLYRYNSKADKELQYTCQTLLRRVITNRDSFNLNGHTAGDTNFMQLPYNHNDVRFEFTAPFYFHESENMYSFKLDGYDEAWSAWSNETKKEYTNLYEGAYTFHVRSRSVDGVAGLPAAFSFKIQPPWYRTIGAYAGYVAGFALLLYLGIVWNTYRLKRAKHKLEQEVEKRTRQISRQNAEIVSQKEEIQAQAEQLAHSNQELEKLSIVASKTENAVAIFNARQEIIWVNESFKQMYGYTAQSLKGKKGNRLQDLSEHPDIASIVDKVVSQKVPVTYETQQKLQDGRMIWVNATLTPVLDEQGQIEKFIAIDSDISRLKAFENDIRQRNEEINAQKEMLRIQNEEIKKQRDKVQVQNQDMRASIRTAQTIQKAILPAEKQLRQLMDYFLIYRPKDIVSGDFYWYSFFRGSGQEPDQLLLAVVDCTGHGVPGAFMSMIGNRLLNEIVNEQKIKDPAYILELLDEKVIAALRQKTTENRDGMNLLIVNIQSVYNKNLRITYAGAMTPLFYYHSGKHEIERIRGTRRPIGGISQMHPPVFKNHDFTIRDGDMVYLLTDGIIDQNGPDRRRFGTPRLKRALREMAAYPLDVQKEYLEDVLDDYQDGELRRDDITFMGVSL